MKTSGDRRSSSCACSKSSSGAAPEIRGFVAPPVFRYLPAPALTPQPGCPWAETMVLNPAIIKDPDSNALHMLFRASGPYPERRARPDCVEPYPIFLGYARSDDLGRTWAADFSRPALAPALEYETDRIYTIDDDGRKVVNYANGCIEDPRVFAIEGVWYMSVACRLFPPGPYWKPRTAPANLPGWATTPANPFGKAASWNDTTTVLYRLHLDRLIRKDYDRAFVYVGPLTDTEVDDNRDAFLFPERMTIDGVRQYVLIHRPRNPSNFEAGKGHDKPSILLAAAPTLKDFVSAKARHHFLAGGIFDWEGERVGASWPPIKIGDHEWLMQVHGKTYPGYGYSQSFVILKQRDGCFPEISHRCPDRLMSASQEWEKPGIFEVPCLFTTAGVVVEDTLIISYGAADQVVGIAWVNLKDVVRYVRSFDAQGQRI